MLGTIPYRHLHLTPALAEPKENNTKKTKTKTKQANKTKYLRNSFKTCTFATYRCWE